MSDRLALSAYAAAACALVGLVLVVPALYLVDLPAWTYTGALWAREVATGDTPAVVLRYPVPNTLATVLPGIFVPAVGAAWAGKIVGALLLGGGFAAALALARASKLDGAPWRAAVVASMLVASSSFWNGYVGFQLGVVGAMAVGAWALRRGRLPAAGVGAVSVGLFFCHAVPFGAVALGAGLDALRRRDVGQIAALVPAALLTVAYVAFRAPSPVADVVAPAPSVARWAAYKAYTALKLGPFQPALGPANEPLFAPAAYWAGVGLAAAFVAVLVVALAWGTRAMVRARAPRRAVALYGWALVGASLPLPMFALSVVNPGERVLALGALALLAVVPLRRRVLVGLGVASLAFLADDAAALWEQRTPLPQATVEALAAEHVATARAEAGRLAAGKASGLVQVGASPYAGGAQPLLNHPVYLQADSYAAADARDWTRRLFGSSILAVRPDRPSLPAQAPQTQASGARPDSAHVRRR